MNVTGGWFRSREGRTVSLGVSAILLILVCGRAVPAGLRWRREAMEAALQARSDLAAVEQEVTVYPQLRDSSRARQFVLGGAFTTLLHGTSAASASADFVGAVSDAAAAAGVRLGSTDVRVDSAQAGFYQHFVLAADGVGDVRGIVGFLSILESGETRVRIRSVTVSQPDPYAAATTSEALHVSVTIEALGRHGVTRAQIPAVAEMSAP